MGNSFGFKVSQATSSIVVFISVSHDTCMDDRQQDDRVSPSLLLLYRAVELNSLRTLSYFPFSGDFLDMIAWKWEIFLCLKEKKVSFYAYDSFVARRVDVKIISENCNVIPCVSISEL